VLQVLREVVVSVAFAARPRPAFIARGVAAGLKLVEVIVKLLQGVVRRDLWAY
jgi:hypothetical protein